MAQKTVGKSVKVAVHSSVSSEASCGGSFNFCVVIRGSDQMFYDVLPTLICVATHVEIQ